MYAIGIDLGTTGCKALVAASDGSVAGQEYIEYPLIILSSVAVEQDAALWWELTGKAVRGAITKSGIGPDQITAISVASQGISFVLTDGDYNPINNAVSWLDSRAGEEAEEIAARYPIPELYRITGLKSNGVYMLPKLLWLKKHCPGDWNKARHILMAHDFITAMLTGETVTDHTMAGGTMLYDVLHRQWNNELLKEFDIDDRLLPEIRDSGSVAGQLSGFAAAWLGLRAGIPVAVGGQDQKTAAFTAGAGADTATLSLGTAGAIEFVADHPVFDPQMRIPLFAYVQKGWWTLESVVSIAGASLKWMKTTLFPELSYRRLDKMAANARPGSDDLYFFPHFGGATSPHWNPDARGVFYGLNLNTEPGNMIRSVLEGIAFQIRENLMVGESLCGGKKRLRIFGSGGSSDLWCQIFADVTGKRVETMSSPDAAGLGAAKLAFMATGADTSAFDEGVLSGNRVFQSDPERIARYTEVYKEYIRIEKKII